MEELTNAINLKNTHPITDEVGESLKPFRFKLTNTCGVGVDYNVNLEVMETESRIASKNIATKVDENAKSILSNNPSAPITYKESDYTAVEAYTIYSGEIKPYDSITHEVRIWLDESAGNDSQNGTFYSKVVIDARQNQVVAEKLISKISLGSYINMNPILNSYQIPSNMTGYSSVQEIYPSELNLWQVISINEDETIEMVSAYLSSTLVYIGNYNQLVGTLQNIATQYENDMYTISSRHMGYNGQTYITPTPSREICGEGYGSNSVGKEHLGCGDNLYQKDFNLVKNAIGTTAAPVIDTENFASYWLASKDYYSPNVWNNGYNMTLWPRFIDNTGTYQYPQWENNNWFYTESTGYTPSTHKPGYRIRPILTLKSNVLYEGGEGTQENPYRISINE